MIRALGLLVLLVAASCHHEQPPTPPPSHRVSIRQLATQVDPEMAAAALRAMRDACPGPKATQEDIESGRVPFVNPVGVAIAVAAHGPSWINCIHAANDCDDINDNIDCNPHADPKTARHLRTMTTDDLARRKHRGACLLANENTNHRMNEIQCERNFQTQGEALTKRMLAVKRADDLPTELRMP